jgi:hypothetical protein
VDVATRLYHVQDGGFRRGAAGKNALSANMLETPDPWKFSVEGES